MKRFLIFLGVTLIGLIIVPASVVWYDDQRAKTCDALGRRLSEEEFAIRAFGQVFEVDDVARISLSEVRHTPDGRLAYVKVSDGEYKMIAGLDQRWGGLFGGSEYFAHKNNEVEIYVGGASFVVMNACGGLIRGSEWGWLRESQGWIE